MSNCSMTCTSTAMTGAMCSALGIAGTVAPRFGMCAASVLFYVFPCFESAATTNCVNNLIVNAITLPIASVLIIPLSFFTSHLQAP